MSMSVTSAEAGLIAAPWQAAEQDAALEQAAKNFYDQTKDLTQHGKKDHPTDRIVLGDVAATLALELGAQDPAHRAGSLSEYVKLPGSGDGFQITVDANGSETLNRTPDGPGGATSLPGGDAVIAQYAAVVGHTPSQDEMAGFLAAAVAGGGLPAGTNPATAQLTVTGQDGSVLATGTASQLLSEWSALLAANEEVTPTIILAASSGPGNDPTNGPGEPQQQAQILNGTEGAAFLLGLAIQGGATTGAMVAGYNSTVAYFDQIDQPMLAVAVHYEQAAEAAQQAGNANGAELDETAAKLALQIAAEPEDARGSLSQKLDVGGHQMLVTVNQTTTDITGGAQFHHDDPSGILGIVEEVVGTVADVLSFVPVVDAIAIPVAIAVGAAEGGQDLASGNILGGVLALAGSAAGGVGQYASAVGQAIGDTTADVASTAKLVSEGVAGAQGVMGAVTGAEDGDPLAVLTSIAGGVAGSVGAGTAWGQDLAAGSALAGAGVAAVGGNWASALAATTTAAGSAGLFGTYDPDASSAAPSSPNGDNPPAGWQSAAVQPVQQEDLPPLAAAAPADAGPTTPASLAAASSTASAQADVAATVGQAANTSPADPGAPDGPNGSSQQQADAQQAAQQQAAQRAGATMAAQAGAAQTNTDSLPLPVPPIPPAVVPLSPAAQADADAIMAGMGQSAGSASPAGQVQLAQNLTPNTASDVSPSTGGSQSAAAPPASGVSDPSPATNTSPGSSGTIGVSTSAVAVPNDPLQGVTIQYDDPIDGPKSAVVVGRSTDDTGFVTAGGGFVGYALVTSVAGQQVWPGAGGQPSAPPSPNPDTPSAPAAQPDSLAPADTTQGAANPATPGQTPSAQTAPAGTPTSPPASVDNQPLPLPPIPPGSPPNPPAVQLGLNGLSSAGLQPSPAAPAFGLDGQNLPTIEVQSPAPSAPAPADTTQGAADPSPGQTPAGQTAPATPSPQPTTAASQPPAAAPAPPTSTLNPPAVQLGLNDTSGAGLQPSPSPSPTAPAFGLDGQNLPNSAGQQAPASPAQPDASASDPLQPGPASASPPPGSGAASPSASEVGPSIRLGPMSLPGLSTDNAPTWSANPPASPGAAMPDLSGADPSAGSGFGAAAPAPGSAPGTQPNTVVVYPSGSGSSFGGGDVSDAASSGGAPAGTGATAPSAASTPNNLPNGPDVQSAGAAAPASSAPTAPPTSSAPVLTTGATPPPAAGAADAPNGLMMPSAQLASLGAASLALGGTTAAIGTVPTSSLGSLAPALPALPALPELAPLAVVAPALVLPLTLSGDTIADPNAPVSVPVQGQPNLSAWASPSQVTLYQTSPALFGLLSTVQGTATLQYAPGGSPNSASLVDGQGTVQGTLQGGQIILTNPAALTFNPPGSTPAPVAPATPANAGTPSASSLAGVAVRLGNTAAMTGLDAGAIPANPGFTPAPPMAPLPGYTPVGNDQINLGQIETFPISDQAAGPISTGTPLPDVNVGNWQESIPVADPSLPTILANEAASEGVSEGEPFTSTDPLVGDLANQIEAAMPGTVKGVNVDLLRPDGTKATDIDIQTDQAAIQVKSGSGSGLTKQMITTSTLTGQRTIAYGPELGPTLTRNLQNLGYEVYKNPEDLIEALGKK